LNYSANPNVCKDGQNSSPVRADTVLRPVEVLVTADAIQYQTNGDSHAILWGVRNQQGREISFNDAPAMDADLPLRVGLDLDQSFAVNDPNGSDFRYRHGRGTVEGVLLDGHAFAFAKGQVKERHVYTSY
jgi:hypothetical protein